jgi:hypothetical protein
MPRPVRRIVTTNDENGKSEVLLDGPATNSIASILTELWVTDGRAANHGDRFDHATKSTSLEPPPGGTVFRFFTCRPFPPSRRCPTSNAGNLSPRPSRQ